jgi:hypothetical protein
MFWNDQWFIHAVSDNVTQLAQQKRQKTAGSYRVKEGVVGKTYPFQRIGQMELQPVTTRDADTIYANPPQSKRRAVLTDWSLAVLIDTFDELKMLANPQSEAAQILTYAREKTMDDIVLDSALASVLNVNESAESVSTSALPASQIIVNGATGLTLAKVRQTMRLMDESNVDEDGRYFFYSPAAADQLMRDSQVTSSDFNTVQLLARGGFRDDDEWMGFKWRKSTRLNLAGTIRSCIAWQRMGMGVAIAQFGGVEVDKAVHKNNNMQALLKLSAGGCRIDDACVVQVDIDEAAV